MPSSCHVRSVAQKAALAKRTVRCCSSSSSFRILSTKSFSNDGAWFFCDSKVDIAPFTMNGTCFQNDHSKQQRLFSTNAAEQESKDGSDQKQKVELTFRTPRVKNLYERMIKLSREEVSMVGKMVLDICGKPMDPNGEFYYDGWGVGGGKKGAAAAEGEGKEAEEETKKKVFDVKLMGFDAKSKIKVIKEVRSIAGLGLKEAKELVESAPTIIQKDLSPENAEELKKKLEEVGAELELV